MEPKSIAVDEDFLREILGGSVKMPSGDYPLMAARAITDFHRADTPDGKFGNVLCWVRQAYYSGYAAGQRDADENWKERIRRLFCM